ncbi:MAG: papain-like cysteine protease family protein [Candidatus Limnocylindrales bacterium]
MGPVKPTTRRRRRRWPWVAAAVVIAVIVSVGTYANVGGMRTRLESLVHRIDLAFNPPVDRATVPTIEVTPPPDEVDDEDIVAVLPDPSEEVELLVETEAPTATAAPATSRPTAASTEGPVPTPTRTPRPERKPVRFRLKVADPDTKFISQSDNTMCAAAGIQMVLGMHDQVAMTKGVQARIDSRLEEWETRQDAKAGGWGPSSMAEALAAYGVAGYEVRAYENRNQSLREAAKAMVRTGAPAILIAWRGAHTWVMTGFRADADPTVFKDARITGINVFDPWYPVVSTIWGPSDPAGTLQDLSEIKRNFLQWQRPEGSYPERDGKYIIVVPTIPLADQMGDAR